MRKIITLATLLTLVAIPSFLTGCLNTDGGEDLVGPAFMSEQTQTLEEKYGEEVIAMFKTQDVIPAWEEHLEYTTRALKVREEITPASISDETLASSYSVVGYEELKGWSDYIVKMLRTAKRNKDRWRSLVETRENMEYIYIDLAPNDKYVALKQKLIDRCLVAIYAEAWPEDFIPAIKGKLMFLPNETREFIKSQKK